tara:strand:+ start:8452 stop:9315 length:864 start_codon:yes stop_codon:yes gene_type:complete
MYSEELFNTQKQWAEKGLFLMRELLPLMAPVGTYEGWEREECSTIGKLLSASARSTESALLLMAYGQLWDAEVLIRSVFESTLKFAYLIQSHDTFKARYSEFADEQPEIIALQDDRKARQLLDAIKDPAADSWRPIRDMVLPNEKREELASRYPKTYRRQMDMKWGYGGMLNSLSNSADTLFANFTGLSYGYSVASHIHHVDFIGISIPLDRDWRSPERRNAIHLAHLARLISDCFACFQIRLFSGYRFVEGDRSKVEYAITRINHLLTEFESAQEDWVDMEYGDRK